MVVVVTRLGVTVFVFCSVTEATVIVDGGRVLVHVSVSVLVVLITVVVGIGTMTVGVIVKVLWGPTLRKKSRSYAIGEELPLLLIIRIDQSPVHSWSLSIGLDGDKYQAWPAMGKSGTLTTSTAPECNQELMECLYNYTRRHSDPRGCFLHNHFGNLESVRRYLENRTRSLTAKLFDKRERICR